VRKKAALGMLAGTTGALIAIPSALVGLGICVICVLMFPIGLLGFPFAIGFFLPLLVWLGWLGNKGIYIRARNVAEKVMRGEHVSEDEMMRAVNYLMESKGDADHYLGRVVKEELDNRRKKLVNEAEGAKTREVDNQP